MGAQRVTVSLPPDLLHEARSRVATGEVATLSALVAVALRRELSRGRALAELERVGRRPTAEALAAVGNKLGLDSRPDSPFGADNT